MKVYIAARFDERAKMEIVADRLKALGHTITSSWVYGGEDGLGGKEIAVLDIGDVDKCDTLVSFTHPRGSLQSNGGGRHVEFGYGLARGKRLILIGARENVFHHFPGVEVYPTLDAWLGWER